MTRLELFRALDKLSIEDGYSRSTRQLCGPDAMTLRIKTKRKAVKKPKASSPASWVHSVFVGKGA